MIYSIFNDPNITSFIQIKIWFQNRRTKWKKHETSNGNATPTSSTTASSPGSSKGGEVDTENDLDDDRKTPLSSNPEPGIFDNKAGAAPGGELDSTRSPAERGAGSRTSPSMSSLDQQERVKSLIIKPGVGVVNFSGTFGGEKLPPDHLLLDMFPNIGPLISRWELDNFKKLLKQKLYNL
jgi:hypothetical protein